MPTIVEEMRNAGFSDEVIGSWAKEQAPAMKEAGFSDDVIESYFSGMNNPGKVPPALINRISSFAGRVGSAAAEGFRAGMGGTETTPPPPLGLSPESEKALSDYGLFHKPGEPYRKLQLFNETLLRSTSTAADAMLRGVNAGLMGVGAAAGQVSAEAMGVDENQQSKARRDTAQLLALGALVVGADEFAPARETAANQIAVGAMLNGTDHPMTRAPKVAGTPDEVVGRLPQAQDFTDAATVVRGSQAPATPPPAPGFVRMYHGGAEGSTEAGGGRWLTPDPKYAKGYAGESGKVYYVDIPEDSPHLKKSFDDTGTSQTAPFVTFEAPEDIARNLQPYQAGDLSSAREKLTRLYEDHGIHPAEVAADAQSDPAIKGSILSDDPKDLPAEYVTPAADVTLPAPEHVTPAARTWLDDVRDAVAPERVVTPEGKAADVHPEVVAPAPEAQPETIKSAAVRYKDQVFESTDHGSAASELMGEHGESAVNQADVGFTTSGGRFVSRDEAEVIAGIKDNGDLLNQIKKRDETAPLPAPTKGPRGRDPATYSLFEYLASRGGLAPSPELASILDGNPFVPGFGRLIRKNGMSIDRAWEATARDARYLNDVSDRTGGEAKTTSNELLRMIEEEARGAKQYQLGAEGTKSKAQIAHEAEANRVQIERAVDDFLSESGYGEADPKIHKRTVQIMEREGVSDPEVAFERAVMEDADRYEKIARARKEEIGEVPGWDAADTRAAPSAGGSVREPRPGLEPGRGGEGRAVSEGARSAWAGVEHSLKQDARAAGFDTSVEYWHGTTRGRFTTFKESTLDTDVLGPAVYLSRGKAGAEFYGPGRGGDLLGPFYVRGNIVQPDTPVPWDIGGTKMVPAINVMGKLRGQLADGFLPREPWGVDLTPAAYAREFWKRRGVDGYDSGAGLEVVIYNPDNIRAGFAEPKTEPGAEGKPHPLGAAAADEAVPAGMTRTPSPAGKLVDKMRDKASAIIDMWHDIQMQISPMVRGTKDTMPIAKDFANAKRANRYDWSRIDADLEKRFTPEQRKRMWDAADEESVLRQEGKASEHMGIATLTREERAAVEELQARGQAAFIRARDLGMVEGEGLPSYTPRMVINIADALEADGAVALNRLPSPIGLNLSTTTAQLRHRKYLTAEETEAAAKAKFGEQAEIARDIRALPLATAKLEDAIAGRTLIEEIRKYGKDTGSETVSEGSKPVGSEYKWFPFDHPAFKTWRPMFKESPETGKLAVVKSHGEIVFEQVPIYVREDFRGPLLAVLSKPAGPIQIAFNELKAKTMSLIMLSPMIHNAVEYGRAFPTMPGKMLTFRVYRDGGVALTDPALMRESINHGLVPIARRGAQQDITSIMEAPNLKPGRSITSDIVGYTFGLLPQRGEPQPGQWLGDWLSMRAGIDKTRADVDKLGDFWHGKMLWDQIAKLQMGLYTNIKDKMVNDRGIDPSTASYMAAHMANRYAGALPQEAMSNGARIVSNVLFFSRTFTLGNIGVMKDMFTGMPKDVLAMIEREVGKVDPKAVDYAKSVARRKAISAVVTDIALFYVVNSLLQSGFNYFAGRKDFSEELQGYVDRFAKAINNVSEHPLQVLNPFTLFGTTSFLGRVSSTSENEPGKQDRVLAGHTKDGTAIYLRNPFGKIGEEFLGWGTTPLDMIKRKEGTIARPMFQLLSNDKGFGRKVYDPNADTPEKVFANAARIAQHLIAAQTPEQQIRAARDLATGEGDPKINAAQTFGPFAGITFSRGAPGGEAVGELFKAREIQKFRVNEALPEIRRMIQRGDTVAAVQEMVKLGMPAAERTWTVRTTLYPGSRLSPKAMRDFYLSAEPEQRDRMERAMQQRAR